MPKRKDISDPNLSMAKKSHRLPDWMELPHLAKAFEPSPKLMISLLRERCKLYQEMETKNGPAERLKFRIIIAGYVRAMAVLEELESARLRHVSEEAAQVHKQMRGRDDGAI